MTGTLNSWMITVEHSGAAAALAAGSSTAGSTSSATFPTFNSFSTNDAGASTSGTNTADLVVLVERVQPAALPIEDDTSAELSDDDVLTDEEPTIVNEAIDDLFAEFDESLMDDLLAV